MDILGQSSLLVGVTSFALGFSILARNAKNKLFLAFATVCTLISAWALSFFLNKIWGEPFYLLHLFFNIWLAPAALGFIIVMVRLQDKWSRRLLDFSLIFAVGLSAQLLLHSEPAPWVLQLVYFLPAVVVIQILRLMWIDRKLRRGGKREAKIPTVGFGRRNLIYLGGLLALCTCVMDHIPFLSSGPWLAIPSFGNFALTIYLFFVSQAISQQRLLNFNALFSRFLVLVAVALTMSAVYAILVGWIENSPGLFFLNSFIASFLVLMLLDPLRQLVGYFTERLLSQRHRRLDQTLREAHRKLAGIVDPASLFQAVLVTVEQTLQPERASLYTLSYDGTRFRRVRTVGELGESEAVREILPNQLVLRYCEKLHARGDLPILLDQILENEIDRTTSRVQKQELSTIIEGLKAFAANLLIPLFDSSNLLGFIAIRASSPPEPWGSNWALLPIIYPYFEQAGNTLRNMEIYTRQKEKDRLAALGEMAAGLAHEIRNPLGAIKGAAQYLDPMVERPESQFLKVIIEETDRLNRVVTQFLDYSKPANKDFKLVDLNDLMKKTLVLVASNLDPAIEVKFQAPDGTFRVQGSAEQIKQVLINLIQNSGRALEGKNKGRIDIALEPYSFSQVALVVEDNGPGIKKENLDKLFIPFFTTSPSGTGLGLSISQKIIEAHGGRIEVSSEEGRFARFSVVLPLMQGESIAR